MLHELQAAGTEFIEFIEKHPWLERVVSVLCVCVCVCMCACARVCARTCMCTRIYIL